ncbi:MATE family efflux transporter [Kangiella sp. HZ709]|uniref:MATE family efflux transporter n=1 Tax=Kangiella sp. HZ709 TaxID=2666328 RepID=UPI0012B00973|nr:MATE family efflux transporter [Kangiella sp. HZ709]MRX27044.1 MATE family efflux transporter [Kangiella sp. HZ709]
MSRYQTHQVKRETHALIKIAIPAILAQLAQMALGVSDTIMAGNYSPNALAAVGTGFSLFVVIFSLFMGMMIAINPMVAQLNGQQQEKQIGKVFQLGFVMAVIFGIISFIALNLSRYLLDIVGIPEAIVSTTSDYLSALSWGTISAYLFLALRSGNEGLFSTKAIMVCSFLAIPFNIVLNYWFIFGGLGVEAMGAVGAGYATSIVWTILFVSLAVFTLAHKPFKKYDILKNFSWPTIKLTKEYFHIGIPIALGMVMEIAMFGGVGIFIARYGEQLAGAHQIAMNIAGVAFMVPLGLSVAVTARVGYWLGQERFGQMRLAGYCGIGLSLLFQIVTVTIMLLLRYQIVGFYTNDLAIIEIAAGLIFLAAIFQFSDGLQVNAAGALRGMKDTAIPMVYMAISYWLVGFPLGYYLAEFEGMKAQGYWIGIIAGLTMAAILLLGRFIRKTKSLRD